MATDPKKLLRLRGLPKPLAWKLSEALRAVLSSRGWTSAESGVEPLNGSGYKWWMRAPIFYHGEMVAEKLRKKNNGLARFEWCFKPLGPQGRVDPETVRMIEAQLYSEVATAFRHRLVYQDGLPFPEEDSARAVILCRGGLAPIAVAVRYDGFHALEEFSASGLERLRERLLRSLEDDLLCVLHAD